MENTDTLLTQNVAVVAFKMNQRIFAMPLEVILQILPMMTVTPIPHISKIVKGTINIRGEDVLVVSLRSHFGMEDVEPQLYTPLLLTKMNGRSLALIVDAVMDVMNLPVEKLTGLGNILPDGIENIPMMKGIARYNNETILVLDPERLFYNRNGIAQGPPVELKASAGDDPPVHSNTPVEPALVSSPPAAPVAEKKSAARKQPAAKKTSVEKSAPVVETPAAINAPVEDLPAAITSAPIEETPAETVASAPVENISDALHTPAEETSTPITPGTPVDDAPEPPVTENN